MSRVLEEYYILQCDGLWEEDHGVTIDTLDNPGWRIRIDIKVIVADQEHTIVERSDSDWIHWWVENQIWCAMCAPGNLTEAIKIFSRWLKARGA